MELADVTLTTYGFSSSIYGSVMSTEMGGYSLGINHFPKLISYKQLLRIMTAFKVSRMRSGSFVCKD